MSLNLQNEKIKKLQMRQQWKSIDGEDKALRRDSEKQLDYLMNVQRLRRSSSNMSNLGQEDQQVTLEKNNLLLTNVDVLNNPIVKL